MLLRTPPIELVDYYLDQRSNDSRKNDTSELDGLKARLQSLLSTPGLIEMLALEKKGEEIELALGEALFPFSELARTLDHKKARLKVVPGVVTYDELPTIQECVRVSLPLRGDISIKQWKQGCPCRCVYSDLSAASFFLLFRLSITRAATQVHSLPKGGFIRDFYRDPSNPVRSPPGTKR
jgi:hypothetical protein